MELNQNIENTLCEVIFSSKWKLLCGLSVDGVEILKRGVFALHCAPDLVFKVSNDPSGFDLERRWSNVKRVAEILKDSQFNLLVLPRQTLIRLRINEEKHIVIVEKRLPLTNNLLIHKGLYESLGARLEPALRQLVAFIITSGFYGVDFRHVPILMAPGPIPTIGLVDVSKCGDVWGDAAQQTHENAFFAKDQENVRGLFGCIHPDQFPVVRDEALKCQVTFDEGDYYEALKDRCRDLEEAHRNIKLVRDEEAYENRAKNIF